MTSAIPFPLAEILREAIALNQALSNNNLADAQHRTRLIVTLSEIYDLQNVLSAAQELLARLGRAGIRPGPDLAQAEDALALALDRAFE